VRRIPVLIAALVTALSMPRRASAQDSHLHAELSVGHALGQPQQSDLGYGGQIAFAYELRFGALIGGEIALDAYDLAQVGATSTPGVGGDGLLGVRLRPFGAIAPAGLWLEASGGAGVAASAARPILEGRVGYDLVRTTDPTWEMGPFVGYTEVFEPSGTEDSHVMWLGFHIDLLGTPPERVDTDDDGVFDDEDACPIVRGFRTSDPATNGCPHPPPREDRDADGIPDSEDACPEVQGVEMRGARNGCPAPPPDRDGDGMPDAEDACPDVPGLSTYDRTINGCPAPADRDKDGVLDADDACPDVAGVATERPATNGCPVAPDSVHVEGRQIVFSEVIYFDSGSPRIRHASWGIVKKVAQFIERNPDIEQVEVEGHADEVGAAAYNLGLSKDRAASVVRLLVHFGVNPAKLVEHAYGEEHPSEAGHDEKAHRENRRVEFTITRLHDVK
jgi:outer membrane protein OmpA-like peptidoglycan-associated protein